MNTKTLIVFLLPFAVAACQSSHPECEWLPEDSLVGNAGCMIIQDSRLLMVQQRSSGHWSMPGGTAESGERAVCTAQRETQEETGLAVRPTYRIITLQNGFHVYRCEADTSLASSAEDRLEIQGWGWFDEAERQTIPWRFERQHGLIDQLVREQLQRDQPVADLP
ncbi:MAG: NUDIX hydrolase [Pseudomonadota bacterium]|nr:NUDIX hydrolase [Pseudomonadota bacterium]